MVNGTNNSPTELVEKKSSYHQEERLNSLSHALGILLGIIGLYFLLDKHAPKSPYATLSILIYGVSVILLFTASTLYHSVSNVKLKRKLRVLDHISIYFLIAGTYTPVALITLVNGNGWSIFYTVWGIAAIGTLLKLFFTGKYEYISLLLYLIMGWLIVLDFRSLLEQTTSLGMQLLMLGGAFYTIGIVFYAIRKIPYNHLIWHFFVLGGAISHYFLILLAVI
ncbi:PAQR family membrane homeostasis protein TrhA [Costertonia aggregata]|uniref:Hemolysin III family protein n=1 Tax=Costertonia aggregata TaxID=343403 RepID=A0A7H9AKY8_9FLAO|nr:hemolysin III family protein [Costertonia aggregata]QLG44141.1 hemolysin III family protein [Costertonia aggregata]